MDPLTAALVALSGATTALVLAALVAAARDREYRRGRMDEAEERETYDAGEVRRAKVQDAVTDALDNLVDRE